MGLTNLLNLITGPLTNLGRSIVERKTSKDQLKAKVVMAKSADATQVTMTDAEWEAISKQLELDSWKDELATVVVLYPLVGIMLGSVVAAFTGDTRLLTGTTDGIKALKEVGIDMSELMLIVVLAAVSLKCWRKVGS
jgi:hypothetical protein